MQFHTYAIRCILPTWMEIHERVVGSYGYRFDTLYL